MDRRTFLASALFGAAARPARAATPIGVALLGASHSHAVGKAKALLESDDYALAGFWEADDAAAARVEALGVRRLSREALFARPEIQVVAVESDVADHEAGAMAALEAGMHVHVEKPPALSVEAFRRMLGLAERNQRIVQMGYMWRQHPGFTQMLEAARAGVLGDVYLVRGTINTSVSAESRQAMARFRGGHMLELGCHLIDPLIRLMGRPDRVTPFLKRSGVADDDLADNTLAVFEFGGAMGVITGATMQPNAGRHRSFEILGTNGTATMRPIEQPELVFDLAEARGGYVAGRTQVKMPAYRRYVGDFAVLAEAVRGERPLPFTAAEDLLVQEAVLGASGM